jgi:hypothetical protein
MFGSFLPSHWSSSNQVYSGREADAVMQSLAFQPEGVSGQPANQALQRHMFSAASPHVMICIMGEALYKRLGGYDVIAGIVDDLFERMQEDPKFQRFGLGRSLDSKNRSRQLLVDQLCALPGGPCVYTGRDMKTSLKGLNISKQEWQDNMRFVYRINSLEGCCIDCLNRQELPEVCPRQYRCSVSLIGNSRRPVSPRRSRCQSPSYEEVGDPT